MAVDYDKIKRLIALVEQNRLTELSLEEDDLSVSIKAEAHVERSALDAREPVHETVQERPVEELDAADEAEPVEEQAPSEHLSEIRSPMVGVFYRRPSPDSPPYVEVGDEVEMGQTIGLIEAMKVFSEVPSEASGVVTALPAPNAKLVHQGDVLAVIDTSQPV